MNEQTEWTRALTGFIKVMASLEQRFKSGNEIPVERTHITREEFAAIEAYAEAEEMAAMGFYDDPEGSA